MNILLEKYIKTNFGDRHQLSKTGEGFTIVELLIALTILSIILVMSSVVFIEIGSLYSKGVNGATLQDTTRNIVADVSATMEFSVAPPPSCSLMANVCAISNPDNGQFGTDYPVYAYCIGTTRYTFVLGRELGTDQGVTPHLITEHVLWRDTLKSTGSCTPLNLTAITPTDSNSTGDGYEMMASHMRLTKFIVAPAPAAGYVYNIELSTAFGDSDLLNLTSSQPNCKGGEGEQYCATSQVNTSVTRRAPTE